jgi:hypothetical protein
VTEPAREAREIAWDKFMGELLDAIQSDEVIKIAADTWRKFAEKDERERISLTVWIAAVFACGATTREAFYRAFDGDPDET